MAAQFSVRAIAAGLVVAGAVGWSLATWGADKPEAGLDMLQAGHRDILSTRWRHRSADWDQQKRSILPPVHFLAPADDEKWATIEDPVRPRGKENVLDMGWYVLDVRVPDAVDGHSTAGRTLMFEATVDDYGEVWVGNEKEMTCEVAFGKSGAGAISGHNAPQKVTVARDVRPGERYRVAILAINGPLGRPGGQYFVRTAKFVFR